MNKSFRVSVVAFGLLAMLSAYSSAQTNMQIQPARNTSIGTSSMGNTLGGVELDPAIALDADSGNDAVTGVHINRSIAKTNGVGVAVGANHGKSQPTLQLSFEGLNLFQQRFANHGNQFTVEPPDQGLCVGNGYVLESVNDVLRVFDTNGNALTGPVDLNSFYGYAPAINRSTIPVQDGPEITDPSCYYDTQTQRFYHVVLTLDRVGTTPNLSGRNHLDIAVSNTSSPLGGWTVYQIDATNDGTNGTPNHHCAGGPCLGDYPHIGADAYGFYITTNEFPLFANGFNGAQIYAMSKRALAAGTGISVVLFNTGDYLDQNGLPGFTVWPAISAPGQFVTDNRGTEYLLSSDAVFFDSGFDNQLREWVLTNTSSLDSVSPNVTLTSRAIPSNGYGVPPRSTQESGNYPLGQSLGDPEGVLDSNDSRMQQVYYANGNLWASLDTGVTYDGVHVLAGVAYFVLNPASGKMANQGYVAVPNNNVTYPAIAATPDGRGIVAFTLTGPDYYPSAAYAGVDVIAGAGAVQIAQSGAGPQDGFTEYRQFTNRPRWGDYGAAAVDGSNVWIASEYIGQTCTLAQYVADPTCGGTRAPLGNWSTRVSKLTVK